MSFRRWYPTATTLANGNVLVVSGRQWAGSVANTPEIWNASTSSWQQLSGANNYQLPLYPWMFQAPNGKVFNAGPNPDLHYLDLTGTGQWTGVASPRPIEREYGSAVMYEPGKLLVVGGGIANVTNTTELIDLKPATPTFQAGPSMAYPRRHLNATLLPDGTVLVTGGTTNSGNSEWDAVLPAELWTPPTPAAPTGTWTLLNPLPTPRLYHSTAVLLPDGTVLSAGGGQGGGFRDHPTYELFSPPYLFKGGRPQLTQAPAQVGYGQPFGVQTPDASHIVKVNLIRLSSVTHAFNMNQRLNHVPFSVVPGGLNLTAPAQPADCPPGHYLLFLINADGAPSQGRVVRIGPGLSSTCPTTLNLNLTYQEQYVASCDIFADITVAASAPVSSYRWSIDGVYNPAFDGMSTISLHIYNTQPTRQIQVAAQPTCGGAAAVAGQTFTTYFPNCNRPLD